LYDSVLRTIGKTPIVRLNRVAPAGIEMWVKMEGRNPGQCLVTAFEGIAGVVWPLSPC
jgi:cysteine synthase